MTYLEVWQMIELPFLPNFFIAGAPKAGTSSLHRYISDHPDAVGSRDKETYFFSDPGTHMFSADANASKGYDIWKGQFPVAAVKCSCIIFESTPSYLYSRTALRMIPALPSRPKCLFVLREPATQVYSLFTYFRDNWTWIPANMTFADYLAAVRAKNHNFGGNELAQNALDYACYVDHLIPWREALGTDRILVVNFDDLVADERGFTKQVVAWLGLDPSFYDSYVFKRENETYAPRNRMLHGLNVAVRGLIPRGAAYRTLRKIYRRTNTKRPDKASAHDLALIAALRSEFAAANLRLAQEFGVTFKDAME